VVVHAGPWFTEPALVAEEPFALNGRGINSGGGSTRMCVMIMRHSCCRSGTEEPRQRGLHGELIQGLRGDGAKRFLMR
jgi:hypothetical protein